MEHLTLAPADDRPPGSPHALLARLMAIVAGFLLVSFLTVSSSRAAFTSSTQNAANSVSTASLTLSDNDSGTAMFNAVTGLVPGTTVDRCIDITFSGSATPGDVRVYMPGAPSGTLAPYLDVTVDVGADTADAFGLCTTFSSSSTPYIGTLSGLATASTGYASGVSLFTPSGPTTRTVRVRVAVQDDNAAQGLSAGFALTFEVQSP